jgi:D-glycero-D-manno-heptose 1,7-bisphosphate phosphatase
MSKRPAVFLDRDGTLTIERGYVTRPRDLRLIDCAAGAVRALNEAGVPAVVVSNQSGVARGLMSEEDMALVHDALEHLLAEHGARLDAAYYCPNHLEGTDVRYNRDASCRKPALGMLEQAARDLDLDVAGSVMIGDQVSDLEFAANAGMPGVLVATGKGPDELEVAEARGVPVAAFLPDVAEAVAWFLRGRSSRPGEGTR